MDLEDKTFSFCSRLSKTLSRTERLTHAAERTYGYSQTKLDQHFLKNGRSLLSVLF